MDKDVLVQYREMKKEVKDLRRRIEKLNRFLDDPPIVSDTVKGTRKDGTIGPIKVTGDFPEAESQGAVQKVARGEGGGAAGTDGAGGGVHKQHRKIRIANHAAVVLYRWIILYCSSQKNE